MKEKQFLWKKADILSAELFEVSSVLMFKLQFNHMVAQEIESEAKYEKDFLETLERKWINETSAHYKNLQLPSESFL
ncbi:LOW QUALITY PROTEIN: hypothetical protein NC652_006166 [Populus alba x Populus x berolinensis]|nr:LOW QUALITY PROTEIN: hypothetical protein NC652_006166 [Populus alba x Populus x berolinensis]